jgi:YVTN family beta-propeller protein
MRRKFILSVIALLFIFSFIHLTAASPTVKLTASPTTIAAGQSATLSWTSTGAVSASINNNVGAVAVNGSKTVSPTKTTTYTITVKNTANKTATSQATVTVTVPAPTVTMSASPTSISAGQSSTLTWTSTGATSASINNNVGTVAVNGSRAVTPSTTTTYIITVKNSANKTATAQATVTVAAAPPTVTFSASPATIQPGQSSKLTWSVQNATSISIDNGIGTVSASSSKTVQPTVTTTYTLTAKGSGGTTTRQATITVALPPTVTFSAAPMSIQSGASTTLTWSSTDTTTATIDNNIGTVAVNGSMSVTPAQNTTYTITVSGPGGTATAKTAVYISNGKPCYAYVANSSANNVAVIDTASNTVIKTIPTYEGPRGVTISPDGTRVFVSNIYGSYFYIHTMDTAANAVIHYNSSSSITKGTQFLAMDATSRYLYGASIETLWDSSISKYVSVLFVFDMVNNLEIKSLLIPGNNQGGMALHPDGSRLYLSKPGENAVLCLDTAKLQRAKPHGATYEYFSDEATATIPITNPNALTVSPDGNRLYVSGTDGISVLDTNTNTVLNIITGSGGSLAVSPDGSRLYAAGSTVVQAIDTITNAVTKTLTIDNTEPCMNVHPDGSRLYITNRMNQNISVLDAANLTLIATIPIAGSPYAYGNFVGYMSESIAGRITQGGVGQEGVNVTIASAERSETFVTDASGNYITAVKKGTYSVTPGKTGYTFVPDHQQLVVDQAVTSCDFASTVHAPTVTISAQPTTVRSGQPTTLTWSSTNATSAILDDGSYSSSVKVNGSAARTISQTTTYTITVTGPGGTATANVTVTYDSSTTPTVSMTATPSTIQLGGSSVLSWQSYFSNSATIDNNVGIVPVNGTKTVTPTKTTTYTITVTGSSGTATASATVTVPLPPPTIRITTPADNTTVTASPLRVTGDVSANATVTVNSVAATVNATAFTASVPLTDGPNTLTAVAKGPDGQVVSALSHVTIHFSPPPTIHITSPADNSTVSESPLTVTGNVSDNAMVMVNSVVATITGTTFLASVPLTEGQNNITASATDQYGQVASSTIHVTVLQPEVTFTANPTLVVPGSASKLTWTTTNASKVMIDDIGEVDLNGSKDVFPTSDTTYTLRVTWAGGTVIKQVEVKMLISHLLGIYSDFRDKLKVSDIEGALVHVSSESVEAYRAAFNSNKDNLAQFATNMPDIQPRAITDDGALFIIENTEVVDGESRIYEYEFRFIREADGSWKILQF